MDIWTLIAALSIIFTSVQMIPQVMKAFTTKRVRDISLWMLIIIIFGTLSWLAYGLHIHDTPIIIANALNCVFASLLLYFKLGNTKR